MADSKQDKRDEAINILNNELAGIKVSINTTNNSINAMKDSMDTHLKTITDTMDTRLKTFTDTMNTNSKIITGILVIFCVLAISLLYQRPAPDKTYITHPNSENTQGSTLTSMFQNSATGKDSKLHVAIEGETSIASVDVGDKGYLFKAASVTCQFISELTGAITKCLVKHIVTTNKFQVSYQATSRGRHQLHIKVEGEHIKGSPFTITVMRKTDISIKADKNGICSDHDNDPIQLF